MRIYIEARGCNTPRNGLHFKRLKSDWEISGIPNQARAVSFIRAEIARLSRGNSERLSEIAWVQGTLKFVFDPDELTVDTIEHSIFDAVVQSCIQQSRI